MYMMLGIDFSLLNDIKDDVDFVQKLITEQCVVCLPATVFNFKIFLI